MTGGALELFLDDVSFFRIGTICRDLRMHTMQLALQFEGTVANAWRVVHAADYFTSCKCCNAYVRKDTLLPAHLAGFVRLHSCPPLSARPQPRWMSLPQPDVDWIADSPVGKSVLMAKWDQAVRNITALSLGCGYQPMLR
jgi:hypothetical protein